MHVVQPEKYPLSASAAYKPDAHTLSQALAFESKLGIENLVLVQPSIYGNDNSCLLDALSQLTTKHGRGVVGFDPSQTSSRMLDEWHETGVRGVRVNLKSVGREPEVHELKAELEAYANKIRPLDWVLQLYLPLKMMSMLEQIVPDLDVKVCIDHFGSPELPSGHDESASIDPYSLPGFSSMMRLLQAGSTWVKISAPYRLTRDPEMRDLEPIAKELLKVADSRMLYATDWPHTRFEGVDARPFAEKCLEWCEGKPELALKLFKRNAESLFDIYND